MGNISAMHADAKQVAIPRLCLWCEEENATGYYDSVPMCHGCREHVTLQDTYLTEPEKAWSGFLGKMIRLQRGIVY
jgi:hypothetical protein